MAARRIATLAALVCLIVTASAEAASPFSWSAPALVQSQGPYDHDWATGDLSCVNDAFCVGVDEGGNVVTTTEPQTVGWTVAAVATHALNGVACTGTTFCVAVGAGGTVSTSTDPTGGASKWSTTTGVGAGATFAAIACPSASLCVATSDSGDVLTSTNPAGGVDAWSKTNVDGTKVLASISCPTTTFCVAADRSGGIVASTNPTGGAGAWTATPAIGGANDIYSVSCPSTTLCVASGHALDNAIFTSTNPTGGAGAWTPAAVSMGDVACPATTLCVAAALGNGGVMTATNPTGGVPAWSFTAIAGDETDHISCPTTAFCAKTGWGDAAASTDPTGGTSKWTLSTDIDGFTAIRSITCFSASKCLVGTQDGAIASTTAPFASPPTWLRSAPFAPGAITGLGCATEFICVAGDDTGGFYAGNFTDRSEPGAGSISGISCPAPNVCLAVDLAGQVAFSDDPLSGWFVGGALPSGKLKGLACPAVDLCVAIGDSQIYVSNSPRADTGAWTDVAQPGKQLILTTAVACPSATFCIVMGAFGEAMVAIGDPTDPDSWFLTTAPRMEGAGIAGAITCPSVSECVAVDDHGNVHGSANPAGGAQAWDELRVFALDAVHQYFDYPPVTIACPTPANCVATAANGTRSVGTASGIPVALAAPTLDGKAFVGQTATCSAGSWSGDPTTISYEWLRGLTPIPGATSVSYTLSLDDRAERVSCRVTATNGAGAASAISAQPLVVSSTIPPTVVAPPVISGGGVVGTTTRCGGFVFAGSPPSTITYEWLRDGVPIPSASAANYTAASADAGHSLACRVTATNAAGSASAMSAALVIRPAQVAGTVTTAVRVARVKLRELLAKGLPATVSCSAACSVQVVLKVDGRTARKLRLTRSRRARPVVLARQAVSFTGKSKRLVRLRPGAVARKHLRTARVLPLTVSVSGVDVAGHPVSGARAALRLRR